jgi:hypothetical protein
LLTDLSANFSAQVPPLPKGIFWWFFSVIKHDSRDIIRKNGLDAYMFIHFLKLMLWIFIPFTIVSWPVLLTVDTVNSGGERQGLDRFSKWRSISNPIVLETHKTRKPLEVSWFSSDLKMTRFAQTVAADIGLAPKEQKRFFAHVIITYIFTCGSILPCCIM